MCSSDLIDFYYSNQEAFSRHVAHAHPQWHSLLLDTIEKLIEETSLKQQVEQVANHLHNSEMVPVEIRKETSRVVIQYNSFGIANPQSHFNVHVSPFHRVHAENIFSPNITPKEYEQFLNELANINLKEKKTGYPVLDPFECSETPETISISLFDKLGRCYVKLCKQYISGKYYGNLDGNIDDIKKQIIEITPHLKEYLKRKKGEKQNNGFSLFGLFKKK